MTIAASSGNKTSNAVATTTLVFAAFAATAHNAIVIGVGILDPTKSVSTIVDTAGNVYTFQTSVNNGSACRVEQWIAANPNANAANVITITFTAAVLAAAAYEQYTGNLPIIGNVGTSGNSTGTILESDVATQDASNWSVAAIVAATNSGDTLTAGLGTIRQSVVPALTSVAIALVDNSSLNTTPALRGMVTLSASRAWAATSLELRTGLAPVVIGGPKFAPNIGGGRSKHQKVKSPASTAFAPTLFFPLPVELVLSYGTLGTVYSTTITGVNGTAPYTYLVTIGTLPTGLTLSSGGVISGTPTVLGTSVFTVQITDANGATGAQTFSLTVSAASGGVKAFVSVR